MQGILTEYNQAIKNNNLFDFWQAELSLRLKARKTSINSPVIISHTEELDFLFRALYLGDRKTDFFIILLNNLNTAPVVNWYQKTDMTVKKAFLKYIPHYIVINNPHPHELLFLLRIYTPELNQDFIPIFNICSQETLENLLVRTANPKLRNLIKKQLDNLIAQHHKSFYGLLDSGNLLDCPTFYGNKKELISNAVKILNDSFTTNFADPYGEERFNMILNASDLLFQCGMVEDSLAVILDTYEDYQEKNRLASIIQDKKIYKSFDKLLRRVVPVYSLLTSPLTYDYATTIYSHYFPRLLPDNASLKYLSIYESLKTADNNKDQYIFYEILYKCEIIAQYRPQEIPLLTEEDIKKGLNTSRIDGLIKVLKQKKTSLPHEAFITLELIRLLAQRKLLSDKLPISLLQEYIDLFNWIPSRIFINHEIIEDLSPFSNTKDRQYAERILQLMTTYNNAHLADDIARRPDIFRKKTEDIRRKILLGRFMGV